MSNYIRGRRHEYTVRDAYRKAGWIVIRSAQSQGDFDLVCINPTTKEIRLVQLKYGSKKYLYGHDKDYQFDWLPAKFDVSFKLYKTEAYTHFEI